MSDHLHLQDHEEDTHSVTHSEEHEEGGHGEPWLVSYADMMTLLFGFFVIMYAFAVAKLDNDENMVKIRKELATYFGGKYIDPAEKMNSNLKKLLDSNPGLSKSVEITSDPEGLKISITSQLLFQSGSAKLTDEAKPIIEKIADKIAEDGKKSIIKVEGYTDDNPIVHESEFDSNWELSASRAISVLRVFEGKGFSSSQMQATGFADGKPIVPNRDESKMPIPENQAKNRRVVIKVNAYPNQVTVSPTAPPEKASAEH